MLFPFLAVKGYMIAILIIALIAIWLIVKYAPALLTGWTVLAFKKPLIMFVGVPIAALIGFLLIITLGVLGFILTVLGLGAGIAYLERKQPFKL
jgi:hypothetical protein